MIRNWLVISSIVSYQVPVAFFDTFFVLKRKKYCVQKYTFALMYFQTKFLFIFFIINGFTSGLRMRIKDIQVELTFNIRAVCKATTFGLFLDDMTLDLWSEILYEIFMYVIT